jgi:hypothetical protein
MVSDEYAVAWSVPEGWWELSEQIALPSDQTLYWRVWSDQEEGATIFSASPPAFPGGLMVLSLEVEPEGISPFPPPGSTPTETHWGQRRVVHAYERTGPDARPYTLRLGLAVVRSPYRFNLALDCLLPQDGDTAYREALCRDLWDKVTFPFGLCARPFASPPEPDSWQQVSDTAYGYSLAVPSDWLVMPGVTGDRLTLFSDPEAWATPHACPFPNGWMKIDFSAGSGSDFSSTEDDTGPELEGFTEITVAGRPAWIRRARGGDANAPDSPPGLLAISVYVIGPKNQYLLAFRCWPPTGADADGQAAYHAQCEATFNQILERFQVLSP